MLDKRKNAPGQFKAKREYLLTGLVRCGLCSHTYVGHEKTIRGNKYRYYECSGAYSKGPKTKCKNAHLNADLLEDAVINTLLDNITQHDVDDILSDAAKMINNNTKVQEKKKILLAKRNGLQERMNNLYKILETTGSPDEYDIARLNDIKTELRAVDREISELQLLPELKITKEELMESWQEFVTTLKCCRFTGAGDRNRTGTGISTRGILSPVRLPVPPPRQKVWRRHPELNRG